MIIIPDSYIQVPSYWTDWKATQASRSLIYQSKTEPDIYWIYGFQDVYCYITQIWRGDVPSTIIDSGYTQEQNDLDKADWEDNFLSGTNQPLNFNNLNLNTLGTFQTSHYTVDTSAVQLTPTPLSNRNSLSIKVKTTSNSDIVYIGKDDTVTTTDYPLFNGDSVQLDLGPNQEIWAIGTSAGQLVYIIEVGK